jgi:RHS repeat-associated protein
MSRMGNVTALEMDVITEKSGHSMTGLAVSVCLTPAAPSPLPIPYPTMASVAEGVIDECMRTKIDGAKVLTVGSCTKNCHGNEPGTLKEVVSLNTTGPCFPILGAPIVFIELGMAGITLSPGFMNKNPVPGGGGSASGAGGGGGGGGGAGGGAGGPGGGNTQGPSNGGGGGGGSNSGAAPPKPPGPPGADGQAGAGHPVDVATGTVYTPPELDFVLPGFFDLEFERSYRTSSVRRNVGLGFGWSHSLAWCGERRGDSFVLFDAQQSPVRLELPGEDETAALAYGRRVRRKGEDVVLLLDDGLTRTLRPIGERAADGSVVYGLVEVQDRFGSLVEIEWERGEVIAIVDSVGRRVTLEGDAQHKALVCTVAGEDGQEHRRRLVQYEIDERGDLVRVIDAGGAETRYEYDEAHYLVREIRPEGTAYHFVYSDEGGERRCVETWAALAQGDLLAQIGATEAPTQPAQGRPAPKGLYHMRLEYDPSGRRTTVIDPLGGVFRYTTNELGLVEEYVDARGGKKTLAYDRLGRVVRTVDADGASEQRGYDLHGRLVRLTDGTGRAFSLTRRDDGAIVALTDPAGGRYAFEVGGKGELLSRTDPLGRKSTYEYDERGRCTKVERDDGAIEAFAYDRHGNLVERKSARGGTYRYTYDLLGNPVRAELPDGSTLTMDYDSRGMLVRVTDGKGRALRENAHDGARRPVATRAPTGGEFRYRYAGPLRVEEIEPDGSTYRFGYDALGRLAFLVNPAGERHWVERDLAGNAVAGCTFSGVRGRYEWSLANRVIGAQLEGGPPKRFAYDAAGRLVRREDGELTTTFEYDAYGLVHRAARGSVEVAIFRDPLGRVIAEEQRVGGYLFRVDHTLDRSGKPIEKRYASGWKVSLARKGGDIVRASVEAPEGREQLLLKRDGEGREIERMREGSYVVRTLRDEASRKVTRRLEGPDGAPLRERTYVYAESGAALAIDDARKGRRTYELDAFHRPARVTGLGADGAYRYDARGIPTTAASALDMRGRPLQSRDARYEWDVLGRAVGRADAQGAWTLTYDGMDQIELAQRSDGLAVRYHYDAFGRRIGETRNDGSSVFYGWDQDTPVEERWSSGHVVRRVFGDDERTLLIENDTKNGFRTAISDDASTPYLMVGADGSIAELELDPWGVEVARDGDFTRLRFAGQQKDELTGLSYHRARTYAPDLGAFLSPDPLGLAASAFEIAFVPNTTAYIDLLGLVILLCSDDPTCTNFANARAAATGQQIVRVSQLGNPNALAGASNVDIVGHGSPGLMHYANPSGQFTGATMNGAQLGAAIRGAGFRGNQIHMTVCEGGTNPPGYPGYSTAQQVANQTGATTVACVGAPMYPHATIPGLSVAGPGGTMQPFTPAGGGGGGGGGGGP